MVANIKTGDCFHRGFTLVELLVVLLLVALLAGIATPVVYQSVSRAKESTLKEDLFAMRKAIDGYYADNRRYPESLQVLVDKRYIRHIPVDPVTERKDSWQLVYENDGIIDVHSGSTETAIDGSAFRDW